jgi:hypothetical protein
LSARTISVFAAAGQLQSLENGNSGSTSIYDPDNSYRARLCTSNYSFHPPSTLRLDACPSTLAVCLTFLRCCRSICVSRRRQLTLRSPWSCHLSKSSSVCMLVLLSPGTHLVPFNNIVSVLRTSAARSAGTSNQFYTDSPVITSMSFPSTPLPSTPLPSTPLAPRLNVTQKKRKGKRGFTIFVDASDKDVPEGPATQRSRLDCRVPLMVRADSANSTPSPSPRLMDAPFPMSPTRFFVLEPENWDPHPMVTPPPTPAVFPHNPAASTGPPPPPPDRARIVRTSRRTTALSPPQNVVLYELLGLDDWTVSRRVIMTAWRQKALMVHPDRAREEEREDATVLMQQVNAAAEVLSNWTSRRQYHVDGVLPWAV